MGRYPFSVGVLLVARRAWIEEVVHTLEGPTALASNFAAVSFV